MKHLRHKMKFLGSLFLASVLVNCALGDFEVGGTTSTPAQATTSGTGTTSGPGTTIPITPPTTGPSDPADFTGALVFYSEKTGGTSVTITHVGGTNYHEPVEDTLADGNNVLKYTFDVADALFGFSFQAANGKTLYIDVYSMSESDIIIGSNSGNNAGHWAYITKSITPGQWTTIGILLSDFTLINSSYSESNVGKISLETVGDVTNKTFYIDNIYFK